MPLVKIQKGTFFKGTSRRNTKKIRGEGASTAIEDTLRLPRSW